MTRLLNHINVVAAAFIGVLRARAELVKYHCIDIGKPLMRFGVGCSVRLHAQLPHSHPVRSGSHEPDV